MIRAYIEVTAAPATSAAEAEPERLWSKVWQQAGRVEELKAVFDPRGGYRKRGGQYMPSIVAEIGAVLERHLIGIGLLPDATQDPAQQRLLAAQQTQIHPFNGALPGGWGWTTSPIPMTGCAPAG